MKIDFYDIGEIKEEALIFVVLPTRYRKQWIFVRHKERMTWEIPGGHIEASESPDEAAKRELVEETGAVGFECRAICDYSVTVDGKSGYGRLYYCDVQELGQLGDFEIAEIMLSYDLPGQLTYEDIQPYLFEKVKAVIGDCY